MSTRQELTSSEFISLGQACSTLGNPDPAGDIWYRVTIIIITIILFFSFWKEILTMKISKGILILINWIINLALKPWNNETDTYPKILRGICQHVTLSTATIHLHWNFRFNIYMSMFNSSMSPLILKNGNTILDLDTKSFLTNKTWSDEL